MADIVLVAGGARAVVDAERGGRLGSLTIDGRELLVTAPNPVDRSIRWGSFVMAPWPGRLADARLAWAGGSVQLLRNHGRHAIHGLVFDQPWAVVRRDLQACELSIALDRARWPFGGLVRQGLVLSPDRIELSAELVAEEPMPAALGWHPWFRRTLDAGSEPRAVRVRVAADAMLERRAMIPTGRLAPVGQATDLRAGPALGTRRLDDAYVGVRDAPVIEWPELRLTLEIAPPLSVVTVYTPAHAVCVEPQTAWPNALGRSGQAGSGAVIVEPGAPFRAAWSMRWR